MKKYIITEQQLKEIHERTTYQEQIEEWFPEVFKIKTKVIENNWFKDSVGELFYVKKLDNSAYGYGWVKDEFLNCGCIRNSCWIQNKENYKATDSEVLETFKKEALKRYKVGQRVFDVHHQENRIISALDSFVFVQECLWGKSDFGNVCLFKEGDWAEVVKPKIFTKEQAKTYLEEFFADGTEIQITD